MSKLIKLLRDADLTRSEPKGFVHYDIYVSTPKPDNHGQTGHGSLGFSWTGILAQLEQELRNGETRIKLSGQRLDGKKVLLFNSKTGFDPFYLLTSLPAVAALGPRARASALAERLAA